jgi:hypothetical protein
VQITDFLQCETQAPVPVECADLGHDDGDCSYDPVHGGVDLFASKGVPVQAMADGDVVWAKHEGFAGNVVVLLHEGHVISKYLHLDRIEVRPEQPVKRGQLLGLVGNSGRVCTRNPAPDGSGRCQPHLHFEVGLGLNKPYYTADRFMHLDPLPIVPEMVARFYRLPSIPSPADLPLRRGWYVRMPVAYVPLFLRQAIISVEDKRFYRHWGLDGRGIARALVQNARHRRIVEGGSTITQQAARSAFLATERSWKRKVVETVAALALEVFYRKDAILELYFNTLYWGRQSVGIQAAASRFLQKHVLDLSLKECLFLATLPCSPLGWDITPEMMNDREARMGLVLRAMYQQGTIDRYVEGLAQQQPLHVIEDLGMGAGRAPSLLPWKVGDGAGGATRRRESRGVAGEGAAGQHVAAEGGVDGCNQL